MKKIGLFLDEIKDKSIDEKQKFSKLGFNTGNMLFWHSLKTQLNLDVKSRWYIDHIDKLDLTQYKAFVTTDLIWIRQMQDFSYLNKTLDVIGNLPLIPISVGLQCNKFLEDFKLHPETVKVLKRISEICVMGVRGNYTASILKKYGIENFKVIGCPSMYMNTPGLMNVGNDKKPDKVSMNFETFYSKLDEKRVNLLEYGMEHNFSFVEQAQAELSEKQIPNKEKLEKIKSWLKENGKCFFDISEWRNYLKEYDFSIGSRFHGNVAALWENVPALFITCDSRTQELCEHFSLPHISMAEFDKTKPVEYYYQLADYSKFHQTYQKRVEEWKEFLDMNGLREEKGKKVIYQIGHLGFLINCFLHKLHYHKNDQAIFLIDKVIASQISLNNLKRIENNFDFLGKIFYYNDRDIIKGIDAGQEPSECVKKYFDDFLKANKIDLDEISDVYSIFDTYNAFAVYLSLKKKKYCLIEPLSKVYQTHNRYNLNNKINPKYDTLIDQYKSLSADAEFCCKLYSYDDNVFDCKETICNNAPATLMKKIKEEDLKQLVRAYDVHISSEESKTLFILNSGWLCGANGLKFPDGYFYLYKKIIDFFLPNENIILKAHPNTDFDNTVWKKQFPDYDVISGFFPSFLVEYLENLNIKEIVSTGSSGGKGITNNDNEIPFLSFQSYKLLNKLYVAINLAKYLNIDNENFFHYGIHNSVIWKMIKDSMGDNYKSTWSKMEFDDNSLTIIDDIFWNPGNFKEKLLNNMNEIKNNSVILFINSKNDFIFMYNLDLLSDIYELRIKKARLDYDTAEDMNDEIIYIYCKDKNVIDKISRFYLVRKFENQQYKIIVDGICKYRKTNELSIKTNFEENKKKTTVVFNAQHLSSLYQFVWLRYKMYSDANVILLANNSNFSKTEFAVKLTENGVFNKIISFVEPVKKFYDEGIDVIISFYDKLLDENGIVLSDAIDIITACGVQNLFSIYCRINNIPLIFMEMNDNQFIDKSRYEVNRIFWSAPMWTEELSKQCNALTGDSSDKTKRRYLFPNSKCEYPDKDINIDFINEFYSLPDIAKINIIKCLGTIPDIQNIVLFNSLGWSLPKTNLKLPYHYLPYLLIADYYFNSNQSVAIKDHPQTSKDSYFQNEVVPRITIMPADIPIEFLGLLKGFHINRLISVDSTGNSKISRFVDEEIKLGANYLHNFRLLHKTYTALYLERLINNTSVNHIYGINKEFISNLRKCAFEAFPEDNPKGINPSILRGNIFAFIGDVDNKNFVNLYSALKNTHTNTKVAFLSDDINKILTCGEDGINLLNYIVPVVIEKQAMYNKILSDTEDEVIYFFSRNDEYRKIVYNLVYEYELKHIGLKIRISGNGLKNDNILLKMKNILLENKLIMQNEKIENIKNTILNLITG